MQNPITQYEKRALSQAKQEVDHLWNSLRSKEFPTQAAYDAQRMQYDRALEAHRLFSNALVAKVASFIKARVKERLESHITS
jgi:hypothetical protein